MPPGGDVMCESDLVRVASGGAEARPAPRGRRRLHVGCAEGAHEGRETAANMLQRCGEWRGRLCVTLVFARPMTVGGCRSDAKL